MFNLMLFLCLGGFAGLVVSGGEETGFAFFAQAVALAFDVEDGGAVQEAVEGGAGHDGIAGEDVRPFGEGLVGGHGMGQPVLSEGGGEAAGHFQSRKEEVGGRVRR